MILKHKDRELIRFEWLKNGVQVVSKDDAARRMTVEQALSDDRFADMFLFDAIVFNEDRHLGNFGFSIDNRTNRICGIATLFDHGASLFAKAIYKGKWEDDFTSLDKYAATRRPALYDNWLEPLAGRMTASRRDMLSKVARIEFRRHKTYNLPAGRLAALQEFVRKRAVELLDVL